MIHRFKIRIVPQLHILTTNLRPIMLRAMREVLRNESVDRRCEVQVTLVTDNTIRRLNRIHRHKNKVTDVLSFPLLELKPRKPFAVKVVDLNPKTKRVPLGDIVISTEQAFRQSKEYEHSLEREIAFLTVHAMLHLLGYDHEDEGAQMKLMQRREKEIMKALNILR